ncbi:MAG: alpha/beta hydrolase [Actinomycetaceae bacterium]|nr:alpha/beta hydrolase [Actinomycetaceae bacterium]
MSDIDPLLGFGDSPVPRAGVWSPDVLGPGFEAQALQLLPDNEGEVLATVVRHNAKTDPRRLTGTPEHPVFRALYIHGWNDYFHQRELAREVALAGGEFYGLDLRKYGRSWRKNQTFGWVEHLREYDEDIAEALNLIGEDLPVVLMGHSTGGLTAALWAAHHPGRLAGLWLNSPWLELQTSSIVRFPTQQAVQLIASREPRRVLPTGGNDFYGWSLKGWGDRDGEMPGELLPFKDDPSLAGWGLIPQWKATGRKTFARWLAAITEGHLEVAEGLEIDCPVLTFASTASYEAKEWTADVRFQDAVLDADVIAERAARLGSNVWIRRIGGVHDLALSIPPVRRLLWSSTLSWLRFEVLGRAAFEGERAEMFDLRVPAPEDVQLSPR